MGNQQPGYSIDGTICNVLGGKLLEDSCKIWQPDPILSEAFQWEDRNLLLYGIGEMATVVFSLNSDLQSARFDQYQLFLTAGKILFTRDSSHFTDPKKSLSNACLLYEKQELYIRLSPDASVEQLQQNLIRIIRPSSRSNTCTLLRWPTPGQAKEWKVAIENEIAARYFPSDISIPKEVVKHFHSALHKTNHYIFVAVEKIYHRCNLSENNTAEIILHMFKVFKSIVGEDNLMHLFLSMICEVVSNVYVRTFILAFSHESAWDDILYSYHLAERKSKSLKEGERQSIDIESWLRSQSGEDCAQTLMSLMRHIAEKTRQKRGAQYQAQNLELLAKALQNCPIQHGIDSAKYCR